MDYNFLWIKRLMQSNGKEHQGSFYSPEAHKVWINPKPTGSLGRTFADTFLNFAHEHTHKQLMEFSNLGAMYLSLNKIYELLVDRFCSRYGKELHSYLKSSLGYDCYDKPDWTSMQFIFSHMDDFVKFLASQEDIAGFCEFSVEFRRRYVSLLKHTRFVHEGAAMWQSVNLDYARILPKRLAARVLDYMEAQKEHYRSPLSAQMRPEYYQGYQIAERLAEKCGERGVFPLALLAMSPPLLSTDIVACTGAEFDEILEREFHCDRVWQNLCELDPVLIKGLTSGKELFQATYPAAYQAVYGQQPEPERETPYYFDNRNLIDAINRFEGSVFIEENLAEYFDSDRYPPPLPSISYTRVRKFVLRNRNWDGLLKSELKYFKTHRGWKRDWTRNRKSHFLKDGDENLTIHLDNVTNLMSEVYNASKGGAS